jgi:hypothetical protein
MGQSRHFALQKNSGPIRRWTTVHYDAEVLCET